MPEKVLVTGGCGFIGSHICERLLEKNYSVRILDNLSYGKMENISAIAKDIEFIKGDLRNIKEVEKACNGIDYISHQGALRSVPLSMEHPAEFFETNCSGTANLLETAKKNNVKRIVFASSSSVYGMAKKFPVKESDELNPISPYAMTKVVGEKYMKLYNEVFGLETISLRYFNVFGDRQDPNSQYSGVIPLFAKKILKGKSPLIFGNGKQSRDFTYVSNVAEANIKALKAKKEACGKAFNVSAGKTTSLLEVVNKLNKILGTKISPKFAENRKGDVYKTMGSPENAKKFLNFEITESFDSGLKKTVEWLKREK